MSPADESSRAATSLLWLAVVIGRVALAHCNHSDRKVGCVQPHGWREAATRLLHTGPTSRMQPRTASSRGAAIILALAVSCHALRSPLRLSRPFSARVADVRRRSAAVALDDDGAIDAASVKDLRPLDIPTDGIVLADVEPLVLEKEAFIDRHPLLAKSLSMGVTYGLADMAAQLFAYLTHGEVVPLAMRMRRAISLTLVGCLAVGPLLTVWFDFLEKIVPGRSKRAILKRTILDQAIEVPVMISIIFSLSSLAEGNTIAYCLAKIQLKLLSTWKDCTAVWFPVQLVNQGLVPLRFRVIFQAVVSFFWDTYLSIVSHSVVV